MFHGGLSRLLFPPIRCIGLVCTNCVLPTSDGFGTNWKPVEKIIIFNVFVNNSCNTGNARCIKFSHFPQFPQKIVTCYFKVSHVVSITTNHRMQEVIITALLSVNQSKKVKEWTNDQVRRFRIMKLIHLLVTLLLSFIFTYSAPHTNVVAIQEQLKSLGYSGISSDDNYESSFKCNTCQVTLKYQKSSKPFGYLNVMLWKRPIK